MTGALRRLFGAPGLVALVWLAQLAVALAVGSTVQRMGAAAVGPYTPPIDDHLLSRLIELTSDHPSIVAGLGLSLSITAVGSVLAWTLVVGLVIGRLDGTTERAALGATWLRTLPGVIATSLWHLLLRGVLLVVVAISIGALPGVAKVVALAIVTCVAALALDIARVHVVLHGERGVHPVTALWAFVAAGRTPRLLGAAVLLGLIQLGCAAAILHLGLVGLDGSSLLWAGRLLALVGVVVGLLRLTLVVLVGPLELRPRRVSSPS